MLIFCHITVFSRVVYTHLEKKRADVEKIRTFKEGTEKDGKRRVAFADADTYPEVRRRSAWWRKGVSL